MLQTGQEYQIDGATYVASFEYTQQDIRPVVRMWCKVSGNPLPAWCLELLDGNGPLMLVLMADGTITVPVKGRYEPYKGGGWHFEQMQAVGGD